VLADAGKGRRERRVSRPIDELLWGYDVEVAEIRRLAEVETLIRVAAPSFLALDTRPLQVDRPAIDKEDGGECQHGQENGLAANECTGGARETSRR
jgi:hypothetical protein